MGVPVCCREVGLDAFKGPFQLKQFYDSMNSVHEPWLCLEEEDAMVLRPLMCVLRENPGAGQSVSLEVN